MQYDWSLKLTVSETLRNITVGVLFGGDSAERSISLKTGTAVAEALKTAGLRVACVDTADDTDAAIDAARIDIAFIALHGRGGEDGTVQRILDKKRIPYTGADARASARAFDKWKSKRVFARENVPTPASFVVTKKNYRKKIESIRFPVFVKPLTEGSSIGIRLLTDRRTVEDELNEALKHYETVLIEERIFGREITVGILGNRALPIIELVPSGPFFDFNSKYTKGQTKYYTTVDFPADQYKRYQDIAVAAFHALGARDFGRVDMMVDSWGNPYVLELNTIPGMTETSLLPKAARTMGMNFTALCMTILGYAAARFKNTVKV